jgi:hypothetical protein
MAANKLQWTECRASNVETEYMRDSAPVAEIIRKTEAPPLFCTSVQQNGLIRVRLPENLKSIPRPFSDIKTRAFVTDVLSI